jgi:hypothetical protein
VYIENGDDLNKKFHGTFVKYDGKFVHMCNFVNDNDGRVVAQVYHDGSTKPTVETIDVSKLEAVTFDSMFVNNSELVVRPNSTQSIPATLFLRLPKRQWKRGLSNDNTKIRCPMGWLYTSIGKNLDLFDNSLTYKLLKRLDQPTYPTLKEAVKVLPAFQAVAISPMFAVCLSNISRTRCLIASIFGFIGEATEDAIYVKHTPLLQELRDYVSRTHQPITVEAV